MSLSLARPSHVADPFCRSTTGCKPAVGTIVAQIVLVFFFVLATLPALPSRTLEHCHVVSNLQAHTLPIRDRFPKLYPVCKSSAKESRGFARNFTRHDFQVCAELGEHLHDGLSGSNHQQIIYVIRKCCSFSRVRPETGFELS